MEGRVKLVVTGIVCCGALAFAASTAAASPVVPVADQEAPPAQPPDKGSVGLSDSALREAATAGSVEGSNLVARSGGVVVEVVFRPGEAEAARAAVEAVGGDPGITIPGELIQSTVPLADLEALEADPAVRLVRAPADYNEPADDGTERPVVPVLERLGPLTGEQVQKTNAAAWHAAGLKGQGVKVGIIDTYDQSTYNAAVSAGEIPAASGTFCRFNGSDCTSNMFTFASKHGIGVAETVADMAPSAKLYLATAITAADTQAAMNYFKAQGVKIVTRSETGRYDGPGNGTGPIATVIQNSAVAQGMFYLNAAGNSAGRNGELGTYWRGSWTDANSNGFIEFAPGDELMGFDCSYLNGLRWNDFGKGANTTDYDFYLFNSTPTQIASSTSSQGSTGGSAQPIERIDSYPCPAGGVAYMAVRLDAPGSGTAGDTLEIMTNGAEIEHPQNPFSASGPMADSNSAGAVAVGAVDPALGTTIANYSAQGPTNDNRIKPDLSAAACVKSLSYSPSCFNGTSSATPVTAGAAALALGAGAASTPQALKTYLLNATVDRGTAGTDNVYGRGELRLPNPPTSGDHTPPSLTVLDSTGKSGKTAKLRYRVSDDSGESRERVQVVRNQNVIFDATTEFGPASGGTYFVKWNVPRSVKGQMDFCVVSQDRSGNNSQARCADLNIKKPRKKRH